MKNSYEFDHVLKQCLWILSEGGFLIFERSNDFFIGCDATNKQSVDKINLFIPSNKHFCALLVHSMAMLIRYVDDVPDFAFDYYEESNSSVIMIFPSSKNLTNNVLMKDGSIALTITQHSFFKALISTFKKPVFYKNVEKHSNLKIDELSKNIDKCCFYNLNDVFVQEKIPVVKFLLDHSYRILKK